MNERSGLRRLAEMDRSRLYVIGAAIGILVALVGVWLTPVAAEIGRREMGVGYMVGEFLLMAGCVLTLLCVVLMVAES